MPLFASGTQAAEHGLADLDTPSPQAVQAIATFDRRRAAPAVQGEATTTPTPETVQPIADLTGQPAALSQSEPAGDTPHADKPGIPPSKPDPARS